MSRWRRLGVGEVISVSRLRLPDGAVKDDVARLTAQLAAMRPGVSIDDRRAKLAAAGMFRSQLEPSPDGRPVVPSALVERLADDPEVVFE